MAAKRTGLGRGLDALLGDVEHAIDPPRLTDKASPEGLRLVAVDLLRRGTYQPRRDMDNEALEDLAQSIRVQGIVQPIIVRPVPGSPGSAGAAANEFEIVAGERRWRAAQLAGLSEVPVLVRDLSDSSTIAVALIENIQRKDLNPLEEAEALRRLIDEFQLTHQQASEAVGRSRTAVTNLLRLLELGPEARKLVQTGQLEMGHARALLAIVNKSQQAEVANRIVRRNMTVRATERLVNRLVKRGNGKGGGAGGGQKGRSTDPDIRRLQDSLTENIGATVRIRHRRTGAGQIVVQYSSLDQLEGILEKWGHK